MSPSLWSASIGHISPALERNVVLDKVWIGIYEAVC